MNHETFAEGNNPIPQRKIGETAKGPIFSPLTERKPSTGSKVQGSDKLL